ncbi:hypothetical protein LAZ67_21002197, partial [Cordylochernes scorpioides]
MVETRSGPVLSVAVTEVRLLSDSNHQQFVLHGEGATLTCHYVVETDEVVRGVTWERDGEPVFVWSHGGSPVARGVLAGRVDAARSTPTTVVIPRAHVDMHGTYTCRVCTDRRSEQNELYVTVIMDSCHEKSWSTHSDRVACTESIRLSCTGMFPRPAPACGLYDELAGSYLTVVPFEKMTSLPNGTFDVALSARYRAADWLNYTDLSFRCYVLVMGTSWRNGIRHRLFGDPGCPFPDALPGAIHNVSSERSCWGRPREGAKLVYQCEGALQLSGPSNYFCRSGRW